MTFCPCNSINITATGGAACAGVADVSGGQPKIEGGIAFGGVALVDVVGDAWDGMMGVWPLDETGNGTTDEYQDRTRHALHGTGGDGTANYTPTITTGVFCQPAQSFDGTNDRITLPADSIATGFTVSLWVKPESRFKQRVWFSRGQTTAADKWVFVLGNNFLNAIWAQIQTTDGTNDNIFSVHSPTGLPIGKWHHVACSWTPSGRLRTYINGTLDGTSSSDSDSATVNLTNGNYIGQWDKSGWPQATIMEVRLHPEVRDADWLAAEHDNFCSPSFYSVGETESPIYS